jgi:ABC-type xylose transport system permease subunit
MTSSALTAAQPVVRRQSLVQTLGLGRFTLLIVLLLIIAVTAIGNPRFLSVNNLLNILFQVSALGIVAAGQTILLIAGGLDLSVGAALSVAGLATALTIASTGSIALAVLAGVLAGVAIGAVNGALIATNRATPFIITLGTMTFLQGVAILMSGGSPINGTGALFDVFGVGSFARVPWPVYVMLLSVGAVFLVLRFTHARPLRFRHRRQRGSLAALGHSSQAHEDRALCSERLIRRRRGRHSHWHSYQASSISPRPLITKDNLAEAVPWDATPASVDQWLKDPLPQRSTPPTPPSK